MASTIIGRYTSYRVIFCPMSEVSGTVKQFLIAVNQRGALFLVLSDNKFRKMMMTMTNEMMQGDHGQQLYAARMILVAIVFISQQSGSCQKKYN